MAVQVIQNQFINYFLKYKEESYMSKQEIIELNSEIKVNYDNTELRQDELIQEQIRHKEYIDKLIMKAKTIKKLDSEELGDLECSDSVEYIEFLDEDELSDDSKMKMVLVTGEEIEFQLV